MFWTILLAFTWELPQTILALFCMLFLKLKKLDIKEIQNKIIREHNNDFLTCWSLGEFLFFNKKYRTGYNKKFWKETYRHEYGHSIQSRILGPLYLIFVGLPSVIWNLLSRMHNIVGFWCDKNYYNTPWEYSANLLGGVE